MTRRKSTNPPADATASPTHPAGIPHKLQLVGSRSRLPKPTRVNVHTPGPYNLYLVTHAEWLTLGPADEPEAFKVYAPGIYGRLDWAGDDQLID